MDHCCAPPKRPCPRHVVRRTTGHTDAEIAASVARTSHTHTQAEIVQLVAPPTPADAAQPQENRRP